MDVNVDVDVGVGSSTRRVGRQGMGDGGLGN